MLINKLFTYLAWAYLKKRCFNVKSSASYFHIKTKILADFHICIIVPLKAVNLVGSISTWFSLPTTRSSRSQMFFKIGVLKNFVKFVG